MILSRSGGLMYNYYQSCSVSIIIKRWAETIKPFVKLKAVN